MDIVRDTKIDWLGKKWIFLTLSGILATAGLVSLSVRGLNLGVDFTGGTLVLIRFSEQPELERIRGALSQAQVGAEQVTRFDEPAANQVQIRLGRLEEDEAEELALQSEQVVEVLRREYDGAQLNGRRDLNHMTRSALTELLLELDPENLGEERLRFEIEEHYSTVADQLVDLRTSVGGLFTDRRQLLEAGLPESVLQALEEHTYLGSFTVLSVEGVGPKIGEEMRERAQNAILFSLIGMLIYIAVRFRPVYGLAAILALFHDVFITVGFFSLTHKEVSLTVVAGLLTVVGYSINDSIVIFDRVRENLKLMRRDSLTAVINASINQTLNRTILTSGMTFVAVFALYMLGGEVLSGFSFALVVGIIIGTYSSVAIASPVVVWWQDYLDRRKAKAKA